MQMTRQHSSVSLLELFRSATTTEAAAVVLVLHSTQETLTQAKQTRQTTPVASSVSVPHLAPRSVPTTSQAASDFSPIALQNSSSVDRRSSSMVQGTGGPPPLTDPTLAGAGSSRGTAQDGSVVGGLASASRASSGELQSGAGRSSAAPSGATTARGQQVGGGSGASVEQVRENGAGPGGRGGYPPSTGVWWDGNLGRGTLPAGGSSQAQIGGPHEVARGGPAPSSSTRRTSSTPTAPPSHQTGRPSFPVLPVSQPLPNQAFQTPTQVQAILSLPTPLLLSLARTSDYAEQHAIASSAQAQSYISSMSLPPPSPDQLIQSLAGPGTPVTTIRDHPAIPLLLGQAFCPPTPGIAAPANPTASRPFEPIYASVEDWSLRAARERVGKARGQAAAQGGSAGPQRPPLVSSHSFTEREITEMATQMKKWALREQEKQVDQQVHSSKEAAVILAIQAAARSNIVKVATAVSSSILTNGARPNGASDADVVAASIVVSGGPAASSAIESAMQNMDLSAYAAQYRKELDALASGYFAQLHREALNRLMSAAETPSHTPPISATPSSTGIFPSSQPPSSTFSLQIAGTAQGRAMHVQAAAAAAVAANVMAANEIASLAGERIASMGFDVLPFLPERSSGGLASLDVTPDALAVPAPRPTQQKTSSKDGAGVQPSEEVSALIAKANATRTCTPEKRDFLLAYAHQVYARDPRSNELLGLLHTLETIHPEHLPTLLLMSCVYYTRGELDSSYFYNSRLLSYDPNYVRRLRGVVGWELKLIFMYRSRRCRISGRRCERWESGRMPRHGGGRRSSCDRRTFPRSLFCRRDADLLSLAATGFVSASADFLKESLTRYAMQDATENLLGVLCTPATLSTLASASNLDTPPTTPRYQEALALCDYVESQVYAQSPVAPGASTDRFALYSDPVSAFARPRTLPGVVTNNHVHRLQNLFYAKGNLRLALNDPAGAKDEYEKAIEVALSLPVWVKAAAGEALKYPSEGVSVRDLVVVMTVLGKVVAAHAETDAANSELVLRTIADFGIGNGEGHVAFDSLFRVVRSGGDAYAARLVAMGGGVLPTVLLSPEILSQVMGMLFQQMGGVLPSMIESNGATPPEAAHARQQALQQACQTTSTMLLTLAKVLQDSMGQPGAASSLSLGGIPPSPSLLLPLYYVALALYPSPSTCNNLGILLSTMNATTLVRQHGQPDQPPRLLTGQQLALKYYKAGLQLDPRHPHLFTNLGSLLKDMGQLPQAVLMYKQAVEYNPTFVRPFVPRSFAAANSTGTAGRRPRQPRQRCQGHGGYPGVDPVLSACGRDQPSLPRSDLRTRQRARRRLRLDRTRRRRQRLDCRQRRRPLTSRSRRPGADPTLGLHGSDLGARREAAGGREGLRRRSDAKRRNDGPVARRHQPGDLGNPSERTQGCQCELEGSPLLLPRDGRRRSPALRRQRGKLHHSARRTPHAKGPASMVSREVRADAPQHGLRSPHPRHQSRRRQLSTPNPSTFPSPHLSPYRPSFPHIQLPRQSSRDSTHLASHRPSHLAQHSQPALATSARLPSSTSSSQRRHQYRLRLEVSPSALVSSLGTR